MRFCAGERNYIGSLSCARALMADWPLLEARRGAPVTLMVPPLRPDAMDRFEAAVSALAPWPGLELSLNELGALALCRDALPGTPLSAGPLLAGQDADPRIMGFLTGAGQATRTVYAGDGSVARLRYARPPEPLAAHWAAPSAPDRMGTLARLGASRVEVCAQPAPLSLPPAPPLPVTLYQGVALLTVLPCGDCESCAKRSVAPVGAYGGVAIRRCRNLLYWLREADPVPEGVDRVARMETNGGLVE